MNVMFVFAPVRSSLFKHNTTPFSLSSPDTASQTGSTAAAPVATNTTATTTTWQIRDFAILSRVLNHNTAAKDFSGKGVKRFLMKLNGKLMQIVRDSTNQKNKVAIDSPPTQSSTLYNKAQVSFDSTSRRLFLLSSLTSTSSFL